MSPLWPCNKVLKPYFQSIISQTNNGCSLLSHILAKFLLLDINCENIFALSTVTALTAYPFLIKKCAKMSVFYVKTVKIRWQLGRSLRQLGINFYTINGCSLLSLILAKLLLLDISCENIFALYIVTALTACPFSIK